jgi:hypothetical protein
MSSLFLAINLLFNFNMWSFEFVGFGSLVTVHVDVQLDLSLRVDHVKVYLAKGPRENDAKDDHQPDGEPCHNGCICLKNISSIDLLFAVEVQPCLVRFNFICCEVAFAS